MSSIPRLITALLVAVSSGLAFSGHLAAAGSQVPGLSGTLVITNKTSSTATLIDVAAGRILSTLPTGQGPHEVVLTSDGGTAVITNYGGSERKTLTVIDLPTRAVKRTIDLGEFRSPHGVVMLPGDRLAAITVEASRRVLLVDIQDGVVIDAIPTGFPGSHMIGVTRDGARGFTGNISASTVSELDLNACVFVRSFDVPGGPEAIDVTPDGKEVWLGSNVTGLVSVLIPATGTLITAAEGMRWPYRMFFTPDTTMVIIPDPTADQVRFIERATRRELSRLTLPGAAPQGIIATPDGRYAFLSLSKQARVAILDLKTRTIAGYLAAGETPDGAAYTTRTW